MKHSDIIRLYYGLIAVKELAGAKFAYAVARNIAILKPIAESIEKALKIPAEYSEYEKVFETRRVELCKFHAQSDDDGEPVKESYKDPAGKTKQRYVFQDEKAFNQGYKSLQAELAETYKEMFAEMSNNRQEYLAFLETECEEKPSLIKVKADNLPEGINGSQTEAIIEIIE